MDIKSKKFSLKLEQRSPSLTYLKYAKLQTVQPECYANFADRYYFLYLDDSSSLRGDVQNIAGKIRTREILFLLICNDRKLYFANIKTQYIKIDCYLKTKSRYQIFKNCLIANTCKITIYIESCFHKVINCRKDLNGN